jgi:hypothetical protein
MSIRVVVDQASFKVSHTGPSTGRIWIALDSVVFPAAGWNDFVVVVLEACVSAMLRTLRGYNDVERFFFMEGPYEVEMVLKTPDVLDIRALELGVQRAQTAMTAREMIAELSSVAEIVLETCYRLGDESDDLARLKQGLLAMRIERDKWS